jgi:hypothetical protein
MEKPNVVLKNIKTFRGTDGQGLNADVWVNGIKCMYALDEGNGGEMWFDKVLDAKKQKEIDANIKLMDAYIASLPDIVCTDFGEPFSYKPTRGTFIDETIDAQRKKKEEDKRAKTLLLRMEDSIVFGIPGARDFSFVRFPRPLNKMDKKNLDRAIEIVKEKYCKGGIEILNTNLPK